MTDQYGAFRLNFEQQQKRAKELLKAARAGEPAAVARFKGTTPRLAEAQFLIARGVGTISSETPCAGDLGTWFPVEWV